MKKKILGTITFLFLMIMIPNGVKASPPSNCNEIAPGNYTLGTNFDLSSGLYCIYEGAEVTIDLNGQDITEEGIEIYNQGKLLIKDSNYTKKEFNLDNLGQGYIEIYGDDESSNNKGEVTIDNGNFKYFYAGFIKSLTINNGHYVGDGAIYIENIENIEINDGTISSVNRNAVDISNIRSAVVNGGTFDGIQGNSFSLRNFENFEINGGTFIADGAALVMMNESGIYNVLISSGKFTTRYYGTNPYSYPIAFLGEYNDIFNQILKTGSTYVNNVPVKIFDGATVSDVAEVEVLAPPTEYNILDGDNQEIDLDSDLVIRADGELSKFEKLLVDSKEVDQKYYETKEGSTIVTLKNEFIKTLSTGSHDITFVYVNGEVSTKFTIKAADTESGNKDVPSSTGTAKTNLGPKKIKVPSTGMTVPIIVSIVIICSLLIGGLIFGYSYMKSKKERKKVQ